jgi:hypothetical protein
MANLDWHLREKIEDTQSPKYVLSTSLSLMCLVDHLILLYCLKTDIFTQWGEVTKGG